MNIFLKIKCYLISSGECVLLLFTLGFRLCFSLSPTNIQLYVPSSFSSSQGYKLKFNFIKIISNHSLPLISNDSVQGDPGCSHNCNSIGLTSSCSQIAWAALSSQIYGISTVQRLNYSCRFDQGLHYSASNPSILTAAGGSTVVLQELCIVLLLYVRAWIAFGIRELSAQSYKQATRSEWHGV